MRQLAEISDGFTARRRSAASALPRGSRRRGRPAPVAVAVAVAAIALALGSGLAWVPGAHAAQARSGAPVAHGSARQLYVTGLTPDARVVLLSPAGRPLKARRADRLGALLFTGLNPGAGYRVRLAPHGPLSAPVTVHGDRAAPWDPGIYRQRIADNGYQYLTTRDGTRLAIYVHPPDHPAGLASLPHGFSLPPSYSHPPYPTVIEYSGYGYADPAGPQSGIAVLANLMGFAVVDVNMRGTGCSGGAFSYFEALQNLDGYDVIQTIAHQPWVLDHRVGMIGISYGAISQLFTAQLNPPALEAIAPLSTIDSTITTLYPGGILNTGFAVPWAASRQHDAQAAGPGAGQAWAYQRIRQGDLTCRQNQALHPEAPSVSAMIRANSHYRPAVANTLDPISFVHRIRTAVFLACQWEDEQTGGHCPALAQHFTASRHAWFTFTNGAHIDSLDPATLERWYDFLSLYVGHRAPATDAGMVALAAPLFYEQAMGIANVDLPPDPIWQIQTYRRALATFNAQPRVRILFDNGAGTSPLGTAVPGAPYPGFEQSFTRFPIPGTQATTWYLGAAGQLATSPQATPQTDRFTWNPGAVPAVDFASGNTAADGLWAAADAWSWNWAQNPPGSALSYVSAPLTQNTTVIGGGAVHLWVQASTPNVDLQATVSEVRPDGMETFVQDGWVRADERRLAPGSTLLAPTLSLRAADVRGLPRGRFVKVVIPLYYEGHVYRAGSRIRVTISAPGGSQPLWAFAHASPGTAAAVSVKLSPQTPSSLILPVVPGVSVPTPLPPCPGLRNEPCRPYVPLVNASAASTSG